MKALHIISGGDKGGAKTHVFALLTSLIEEIDIMVVCFMEGVFYQEIQNMPIPSMLIKQKFRYDLTVIGKLVKLIRKERYNIIHTHGARANFIAAFLKLFIKTPIITTVHSDYRMDFTQNLYKKLLFTELNAVSLRFMDYYIGVSQNFKDMLVSRRFPEEKIYAVYNAIDFNQKVDYCTKEEFLGRFGLREYASGKTIVGIIGRFDKVKGHDVFIKACAEVLKSNKNVLFLLAGEGDEQNNLELLAKKLGVEKYIKFLGFVSDIYSFINTIDINVLSSYSESFPYVLLEGALLKKATVSTAIGGVPDLIKEGETGLLAPPADPARLGAQILKMVGDGALRKVLGGNLYVYAKNNFSKEGLKSRHLEIYNDVLRDRKNKNMLFDVMLSGYYGFNNSGDEAILEAIIDSLKQEKEDIKIIVLSKKPQQTMGKYNVFALNRYNVLEIPKYLKMSRVFINGGGSLIQDITSTHSLVYYTYLMNHAKRLGLRVMLYANGIGPITKEGNVRRAKKALKKCDYITLREPESFKELKRFGIDNVHTRLSADPTLRTKKIDGFKIDEIFKNEGIDINKKYFALSFRQWKNNDVDFVDKIVEVIKFVNKEYNLCPLFIPMQFPNDQIISNEIILKSGINCAILKKEYSLKELLGIISVCGFVLAMRLHTLIYSVSVNVPIIGIVYDPKIRAFMEYIKQGYYVDSNNIDSGALIEMINNVMANSAGIKESIANESDKLKVLCCEDPKIAVSLIDG
ncbi:MAG: polysaccharide pyruvyl transferase CsaB [Clostridiales bacterium]|nr:polysaccharide pyruvyl transferase CsaB [Clostridiales bacterium]